MSARPALRAVENAASRGNPCADAMPVPAELRLPAYVPPGEPVAIEKQLLSYLSTYKYRDLGWCVDKGVRDTGPFVNHVMYGTHPSVRIYYSPEMMAWLRGGRHGMPADGAVIIKEQYGDKPAAYFTGKTDAQLQPTDWTFMIRRAGASHDGWFWGEVFAGMFGAAGRVQTAYPWAGYGIYCLRCHASAENAYTFASLENVKGYPGTPIQYRDDGSWRTPVSAAVASVTSTPSPRAPLAVQTFPPEPLDTFVAHAHAPRMFMTSDQCMSCHSAASGHPFGPVMWIKGANVSEYGEWRWSPMALAGRDPVFFSQFESELKYVATLHRPGQNLPQDVTNICMTCHAAMAKRSMELAHVSAPITPQMVFNAIPSDPMFHYGGLARDGISCTTCHHIVETKTPPGQVPLAYFLNHKINGRYDVGPAGELFGPFKDNQITTYPMHQAIGVKPKYSKYVTSSRLCGSCHTISLPVVDKSTVPIASPLMPHDVEQATYLEWLNSKFQDEYAPLPGAQSCQACHMPAGITDPQRGIMLAHIATKIALVQDTSYPETTHAASSNDLHVRYRETGYRRHELLGLNAFLLTLFKQYPGVMGVRTNDFMSGSTTGIDDAIAHVIQQARTKTAKVRVTAHVEGGKLVADVEVDNLTGHRFPSGVAFRRAFIDFEVHDADAARGAEPLFASGRTDDRGRILGANGRVLPSEFFERDARGRQQYQPHYDESHPVTAQSQVQIFEELARDGDGNLSYSFVRRDTEVKDNRLLPVGWSTHPSAPMPEYFLEATYPKGRAAGDPRYRDGLGHAVTRYIVNIPRGVNPSRLRVTATLYYQSWNPAFLAQRTSGHGSAAQRFAALVAGVDLTNTPLRNWKIEIARASASPGSTRRTRSSRQSTQQLQRASPARTRAGRSR